MIAAWVRVKGELDSECAMSECDEHVVHVDYGLRSAFHFSRATPGPTRTSGESDHFCMGHDDAEEASGKHRVSVWYLPNWLQIYPSWHAEELDRKWVDFNG